MHCTAARALRAVAMAGKGAPLTATAACRIESLRVRYFVSVHATDKARRIGKRSSSFVLCGTPNRACRRLIAVGKARNAARVANTTGTSLRLLASQRSTSSRFEKSTTYQPHHCCLAQRYSGRSLWLSSRTRSRLLTRACAACGSAPPAARSRESCSKSPSPPPTAPWPRARRRRLVRQHRRNRR